LTSPGEMIPARILRDTLCVLCVLCGEVFAGEALETAGVAVEFATRDRSSARVVPGIVAEARAELAGSLGLSAPEKVTVRLLRAKEAFLGGSAGKPVELYAGRAYPTSGTIHVNMIALDREGRAIAFPRTVRHEVVHLAVGHTLGEARLPRWFEEGLACAFGSPLPRARADVLRTGRAFRLQGLDEFPREEALVSLAYAQSDSVVRFLIGQRGTPKVKELLRLVGEGAPFEEALSRATGYTVAPVWRLVRLVFSPSMLFLWTAFLAVVVFFVLRRRRRRIAATLDEYP